MGSNFLTSSQVGCFAAPEWVLTFNLPKNYFNLKPQAIQQQQKWLQESDKTSRRSPKLFNKQINMEFYASYVYMSMYTYFDRDDVAYSGMAAFFKKSSDEEREHGEKLIQYQNKRGG